VPYIKLRGGCRSGMAETTTCIGQNDELDKIRFIDDLQKPVSNIYRHYKGSDAASLLTKGRRSLMLRQSGAMLTWPKKLKVPQDHAHCLPGLLVVYRCPSWARSWNLSSIAEAGAKLPHIGLLHAG
jgi:hypothetical protein